MRSPEWCFYIRLEVFSYVVPIVLSVDRGEKFQFNLGKQEVIKGWDQGVATMARGETAVFTITSKYAYGEMGSAPKIPGHATLVFEVQLFDFEGEDITKDKDKGITKRIRQAGQGFDQPNVRYFAHSLFIKQYLKESLRMFYQGYFGIVPC